MWVSAHLSVVFLTLLRYTAPGYYNIFCGHVAELTGLSVLWEDLDIIMHMWDGFGRRRFAWLSLNGCPCVHEVLARLCTYIGAMSRLTPQKYVNKHFLDMNTWKACSAAMSKMQIRVTIISHFKMGPVHKRSLLYLSYVICFTVQRMDNKIGDVRVICSKKI